MKRSVVRPIRSMSSRLSTVAHAPQQEQPRRRTARMAAPGRKSERVPETSRGQLIGRSAPSSLREPAVHVARVLVAGVGPCADAIVDGRDHRLADSRVRLRPARPARRAGRAPAASPSDRGPQATRAPGRAASSIRSRAPGPSRGSEREELAQRVRRGGRRVEEREVDPLVVRDDPGQAPRGCRPSGTARPRAARLASRRSSSICLRGSRRRSRRPRRRARRPSASARVAGPQPVSTNTSDAASAASGRPGARKISHRAVLRLPDAPEQASRAPAQLLPGCAHAACLP